MELTKNKFYYEEILKIAENPLKWEKLLNKKVMISGATGTIGKMMVDFLMHMNGRGLNCHVIALGRNVEKAKEIFLQYFGNPNFSFFCADINEPLQVNVEIDYILHMASNTHPMQYASDPIGTITTNIIGTNNLLNYAISHQCKRFVFLSSVEIYGECQNDTAFDEESMGYINCNSLRAGYPESKRVGEALCQAFLAKHNIEIVIPRLARVYGPTITKDDSKAVSQFLKKALNNENIILKSLGNQYYSYCYISDAVYAILFLMLEGKSGEAYNVASLESDITLKDLAQKIAECAEVNVQFELPNEIEQKGFSKATRAILNCEKIKNLGWEPQVTIEVGIKKTIRVLINRE